MLSKTKASPKAPHVAICEIASIAYSQAESLIRDGYIFDMTRPPEHYAWSGQVALHMILATQPAVQ